MTSPDGSNWTSRTSAAYKTWTVLSLAAETPGADLMVELAYDEGGSGWWPLSTQVFQGS